ncbi:MAG: hypothetical protein VR70_03915 [Rhodospirillaceae bacterium BRH_c57]|nr:MAG: hypothetical protein VR70_03915 [Rhodospirillaceae bacterium BRH_c57]
MPNVAELKQLLRLAEGRIEQLVEENRSLTQFCNDLMDAQGHEAEQMAAMMEQIIQLEDALRSKASEKDEILALMAALNARMTSMREQALQAMKAAADNSSRLQIVRHVFDIAAHTEEDELARRVAEFNAMIAPAK